MNKVNFVTLIPISLMLFGCGGAATTTTPVSYELHTPTAVNSSSLSPTGTPGSDIASNDYPGYWFIDFNSHSTYPYTSDTVSKGDYGWSDQHLVDTQAYTAWDQGWTGQGQNIAIIDDFSSANIDMRQSVTVERKTVNSYNGLTATWDVTYYADESVSHGALVSNIAGGDGTVPFVSMTKNMGVNSVALTDCVDSSNQTSSSCSGLSSYQKRVLFRESSATVSYWKIPGVAKDALIANHSVDLSSNQNALQTFKAIQGHMDNSSDFAAINLSIGFNIPTSGMTLKNIADEVSAESILTKKTDAVVVIALGNSGAPCGSADLQGCNALAVAATVMPQLKSSVIVVGALEGTGASEQVASYSTRPGILANRALMANGTTGDLSPSGGKIQGTSFAAPRVTGAAALLRHKFPNLSGEQAASILLLTASKDINNDGIADFSGASSIYGQGKLDLLKALSPVGSLAIQ